MKNFWNNNYVNKFVDDLVWKVYTSRFLEKDLSLVLHGGSNSDLISIEKKISNLFRR